MGQETYTVPRRLLRYEEWFLKVSIGGNTIEGDSLKARLKKKCPKTDLIPMKERWPLGFDVDHGTGYFRICTGRLMGCTPVFEGCPSIVSSLRRRFCPPKRASL